MRLIMRWSRSTVILFFSFAQKSERKRMNALGGRGMWSGSRLRECDERRTNSKSVSGSGAPP